MNIWSNIYRHHRWSNLTLVDCLSTHGITPPEIDTWAWRKSDEGRELLQHVKSATDQLQ